MPETGERVCRRPRTSNGAADSHPAVSRVPQTIDVDLGHGRSLGVHEHEGVALGHAGDLVHAEHQRHRDGKARPVHQLAAVADAAAFLGADEPIEWRVRLPGDHQSVTKGVWWWMHGVSRGDHG